jgi:hypothetical protein
MLGGSSCCGSATGGAKNTKKKVVKPKKRVVKKIKGGNTETEPVPGTVNEPGPEPGPEPVLGTGGAKKTKKRVVKPKKIVKKYGNRKGGYADPHDDYKAEEEEEEEEDKQDKQEKEKKKKEDKEEEEDTSDIQDGGAKKKKGYKVGVKRALTPYNKFVKKNFAIMKKKFPNQKAPQIMQKVAIEWKIFKNK